MKRFLAAMAAVPLFSILSACGSSSSAGTDASSAGPHESASPAVGSASASTDQAASKAAASQSSMMAAGEGSKARESASAAAATSAEETATSGGIDQGLASVVCDRYAKKEVAAAGGKWKGHYIAGVMKAAVLEDAFFLSYQGEVKNAAGGKTPMLFNCTVGGTKNNPQVVLAKFVEDSSR